MVVFIAELSRAKSNSQNRHLPRKARHFATRSASTLPESSGKCKGRIELPFRRAAYAANRISANLKGSTKQFGWLQATATSKFGLSDIME